MIACAVTDFPQPLSPTRPSVSPDSSENDTPSSTFAVPSKVWKCT